MSNKALKLKTADEAVKRIQDGMTIGIGTGSTVELLVPKIATLIQDKGYQLTGVCTSERTENQAKALNIPTANINDVTHIDIAIDGADEIDPQLNLIKGGGGALFREKVIDTFADQFYVIVDQTKCVDYLGQTFKLPVEVDRFNWCQTVRSIEQHFNIKVTRRMVEDKPFITDNGHYILDCAFESEVDPYEVHEYLIHLVGVIETGYFLDTVTEAIVGTEEGVKLIQAKA
ncbi:TPA: ribose 5-phosphate isomerase A [Staphylococcus delphini]|nr:ribose 5-phosphate isomerase A [Staphylococcus delphini]